ncbi:MAG: hypothetical protein OEL84_04650 [Nitrosopumilus sp.]|nr:hypothetical protein [Nitrosopumilus sp.]MDH3340559.1 hypothetical protein [Nitrosopumilus sp.]
MKKLGIVLTLTIIVVLSSNTVFAEIFENFDSNIDDVFWTYLPISESMVFHVSVLNILDKANYIVHLDIISEKNKLFKNQKHLIELHPDWIRTADFGYPIMRVDALSLKTYVNPPLTSNNPTHIFDSKEIQISEEEMWQVILAAMDGLSLPNVITFDEESKINIQILDSYTKDVTKGLRIVYSGNSEICDNIILKMDDYKIKTFSGQQFFDRTIDLRGYENYDSFDIICDPKKSNNLSTDNSNHIQRDIEKNMSTTEVTVNCNFSICQPFSLPSEKDDDYLGIILGIISGIVGLITAIIVKSNRRNKNRPYVEDGYLKSNKMKN